MSGLLKGIKIFPCEVRNSGVIVDFMMGDYDTGNCCGIVRGGGGVLELLIMV